MNINYFLNGHTDTSEEISFMKNLDLSCEELSKKYSLLLDGKELSKTEIELVIEVIRKLRMTINKQKNQN